MCVPFTDQNTHSYIYSMCSVLLFSIFMVFFFFQCFFNGLHVSHVSLARILYTLNFDRTAHFLADSLPSSFY